MAKKQKGMLWWHGKDPSGRGEDIGGLFEEVARRGAQNVRLEYDFGDERLHLRSAAHLSEEQVSALAHEDDDNGGQGWNYTQQCPPKCPNGD